MSEEIEERHKFRGRQRRSLYDWIDHRKMRKIERQEGVYQLARYGATQAEIGSRLGISQEAVSITYREEYRAGKDDLSLNVKKWQIMKMQEGDTQMLIKGGEFYCEEQKYKEEDNAPKGLLQHNIDLLCQRAQLTSSLKSKPTSSKTQMQDKTSLPEQSDQENPLEQT